jgi:hypothetical protein
VYTALFNAENELKTKCIQDADKASQIIYDGLIADKTCMIFRFGVQN